MPIYFIHSVKVPKTICAKMDTRIRWFWWGSNDNNPRPLCLKARDDICVPKGDGGLGFSRMDDMNEALIAKWGWDFLMGKVPHCLSFMQGKYLRTDNFHSVKLSSTDSLCPVLKRSFASRGVPINWRWLLH